MESDGERGIERKRERDGKRCRVMESDGKRVIERKRERWKEM